ncbi:MAG TPA: CBS domain-containing protein [Planctomycetaceae bacterium]|nr:CBS domain-containing protein [Planctomycetaceae bacterium]
MQVCEIMTPPVASVGVNAPVNEAVAAMRMHRTDFVAVTDEKACVGIVTDEEITARLSDPGFDPSATTVGTLVAEQDRFAAIVEDRDIVRTIGRDTTVEEASKLMADADLKYLAVHDDDNVLVGVISRADVPEISGSLHA